MVSSLNGSGESADSAPVSARPTSGVSPRLDCQFRSGQAAFSWPSDHTGWWLQMQTNALNVGLNTNWITLSGSDATDQVFLPIGPAGGSVFFRLVHY